MEWSIGDWIAFEYLVADVPIDCLGVYNLRDEAKKAWGTHYAEEQERIDKDTIEILAGVNKKGEKNG